MARGRHVGGTWEARGRHVGGTWEARGRHVIVVYSDWDIDYGLGAECWVLGAKGAKGDRAGRAAQSLGACHTEAE
jgi:hypothetical protein